MIKFLQMDTPIRYKQPFLAAFIPFAICFAISIVTAMFASGGTRVAIIIIFGILALASFVRMMPSASYTEVSEAGITISDVFRRQLVPWATIDGFELIKPNVSYFTFGMWWLYSKNVKVGVRLKNDNDSTLTSTVRALTPGIGKANLIVQPYGQKPEVLMQTLETMCQKHSQQPAVQ